MIGTERAINVAKLAGWIDIESDWFIHILTYDFECGCKFEQSYDGREEVHCAIWSAMIAKNRAESELIRAKEEFKNALERMEAANKGFEIGR